MGVDTRACALQTQVRIDRSSDGGGITATLIVDHGERWVCGSVFGLRFWFGYWSLRDQVEID